MFGINEEQFYELALRFINGVGSTYRDKIINIYGSVSGFFKSSEQAPITGANVLSRFQNKTTKDYALKKAEKEIEWMRLNNVKMYVKNDISYPNLLKDCVDAPAILFVKTEADLPKLPLLSIVGSRNASTYGLSRTEKLMEELEYDKFASVSGLAAGIDSCAHLQSIEKHIPTIAVFAQGLDKIYPSENTKLAKKILEEGGSLVSEMPSNTSLSVGLFPRRNRIVAGLSEATVVVESSVKGGAMITARLADSYNRYLFAFPGKTDMYYSQGCNYLIKSHLAILLENAEDIRRELNWPSPWNKKSHVGQTLSLNKISKLELKCLHCIKKGDPTHLEQLCSEIKQDLPEILSCMLHLEIMELVYCLPGNMYQYRGPEVLPPLT